MMGAKSAVTDVFGTQEIETGHLLAANPNVWKRQCVCMIVLRASWGLAPQHPIPLSRRTMEGTADLGNGPSGYFGRHCVQLYVFQTPSYVGDSTNYRTCSSIRIASVPGRIPYPKRFYSPESVLSLFYFFLFFLFRLLIPFCSQSLSCRSWTKL